MTKVTADDIRELLTARIMDPTLVEWLDIDEAHDAIAAQDSVVVVAGPLLSDISYVHRGLRYRIIATANDLRQQGDWDVENPTEADFEAFAEQLSEE